jgi:hypothetical protein
MAQPETPAKQSKSDFVRSQAETLSPAEVVQKAKDAGIELSKNLVYLVRGKADAKGKVKKGTVKKTVSKAMGKKATSKTGSSPSATPTGPVKKTSSKSASKQAKKTTKKAASKKTSVPTMTKADFVRQNPGVTAKDLAAKALFEGIEISEGYVYSVRSQDAKAASKKKGTAPKKSTAKSVSKKPSTTSNKSPKPTASNGMGASGSSVEELLKAAAAELGLGRALEILQGERARIRAVLGG